MPSGFRGSGVKLGDFCKDCNSILELDNSVFKGFYLQSRCRNCFKIHQNSVPSRTKEARNKQWITWKWGISPEEYNKKLKLQLNGCAICKLPFDSTHVTHVDHNHKTGEIRDLLCNTCNAALGMLNEDEDLIWNMLEYLKRHNEKKLA